MSSLDANVSNFFFSICIGIYRVPLPVDISLTCALMLFIPALFALFYTIQCTIRYLRQSRKRDTHTSTSTRIIHELLSSFCTLLYTTLRYVRIGCCM